MRKLRWVALLAALTMVMAACGDAEPVATTGSDGTDATVAPTTGTAPPETDSTATTGTTTPAATGSGVVDSVGVESCDYGGKIQTIEATDPSTVVFTLCSPDPAFLAKLAFVPFAVQPSEHLEATGGSPLENPVGTGPLMIEEGGWARGSEIVFTRNDNYWGEAPAFQTMVLQWAAESTSRILELQSGNAQYITTLAASDYATIESNPDFQLLPDENPNIFYVGMTNTFPPFDNIMVRQAVAMGLDRQRIIDTFYPTGSVIADYFTPCVIPNGCEGDPWYDFDPEAARALLAEAGFPDGFETTIRYRDVFRVYLPEPGAVATEIATQLQENLGITATVEEMESGAFIEESSAGALDGIHLLGWGADYPHVTNFVDTHFRSDQFGELVPGIIELLDQGAMTIDEAEAAPIYADINNLLREHVPVVPVAHGAAADAALASVENAQVPPVGAPQWSTMDPGQDTMVVVQNAEPISLFCHDETDGESLSACEQVLEGLYGYDFDGAVVPVLAEGCEPNEDGTVWTCTLQQGIQFHDGSELDATDVVTSWAVGIDAANPLHVGNTGAFFYYEYLWGVLMNNEGAAEEG